MKIALVNPPLRFHPRNIPSGIAMPPLWVGYIGAIFKEQGLDYQVVDAVGAALNQKWELGTATYRGLSFAEIIARLPQEIDVIALSCMFTSSWPMMRELLRRLREARPDALLMIGGEHPSALASQVLEETPADMVIVGEGEETARALAHRFRLVSGGFRNLTWHGVSGLVWRDAGGDIHTEPRRPRIKEIGAIPNPNWDQIPVQTYMKHGKGHGANQGPFMPMLATRGCPYQCTFCASKEMWTTAWIPRDPEDVVAEMADYHHRFGATDFHFVDLTFVIKKDWTMRFCQEILRRGLTITWQLPGGTRAEAIDGELARLMAGSGLTNMSFAIESGDPATLGKTKKNLNLKKQIRAARAARRAGIRLFGFFIIGFPHETRAGLWRTWLMVLRAAVIGYHEINISGFAPIPGTEDYRALIKEGRLTVDEQYYTDLFNWATIGRQKSYNPLLSDRALRLMVLFGMLSFFALSWTIRPWRLISEVLDLVKGERAKGKLVRFFKSYKELQNLRTVPAA